MTKIDFSLKNRSSIGTRVYEFLKSEIVSVKLPPGHSISENEIAERLQVSRTPVREAFLRLSQEELVTVFPQKGSVVSKIDLDHLEETRFMREHLEVATTRLACEMVTEQGLISLTSNVSLQRLASNEKDFERFFELDEQFHALIFSICHKSKVWDAIQNMMTLNFSRIRFLSLFENLNTDNLLKEHQEIVESIKEQNPDRAEKAVRVHLKGVTVDMKELVKKYPDYFQKGREDDTNERRNYNW
ncbi:GntR family transcriptional regulator [Bacillus alkalicellulosilyticus]|uniref:GntR family transcriptional regulator n=1 Tax=Alkalihalobacterium alkalicellulosilyticum TaxID=1912214 RepID=UPI0009981EB9|nr:GntR family transcriptional regulator [Bacillus alkalicellulosilyticus]